MSIFRSALLAVASLWMAAATPLLRAEEPAAHQPRQAEANGVVNSAIPGRINLTHEAIPILGWPPMQMDFDLAPDINVTSLRPGLKVRFTVKEIAPAQYRIIAVAPHDR